MGQLPQTLRYVSYDALPGFVSNLKYFPVLYPLKRWTLLQHQQCTPYLLSVVVLSFQVNTKNAEKGFKKIANLHIIQCKHININILPCYSYINFERQGDDYAHIHRKHFEQVSILILIILDSLDLFF